MNALHAFLVFLNWFTSTHTCYVFVPDSAGNGQHIVYGGGCVDAINLAKSLHATVTWQGVSQGSIHF